MTVPGPVNVTSLGADRYRVRIGSQTEHEVTARPAALARISRTGETSEEAIGRAFGFLLEREPPEFILRRFALEDIARYFPEFWTSMTEPS